MISKEILVRLEAIEILFYRRTMRRTAMRRNQEVLQMVWVTRELMTGEKETVRLLGACAQRERHGKEFSAWYG